MEYNSSVLSKLEEEMAGRANAILVIAQAKDRAKAASLVERTYPRWVLIYSCTKVPYQAIISCQVWRAKPHQDSSYWRPEDLHSKPNMPTGGWHLKLNTLRLSHDTWHLAPGTSHLPPDTWHLARL